MSALPPPQDPGPFRKLLVVVLVVTLAVFLLGLLLQAIIKAATGG